MKKCVYTYWASEGNESAGFNSTKELAFFLSLSVEYAKKNFKTVELVTNTAGKKLLIGKYKIAFTNVSTALNGLEVHDDLFAYAKLKTYSLQKEPFVHIDIDVILWEKIPANISKSKIFFQNKEPFTIQPGYKFLVEAIQGTTTAYFCREKKIQHAYNCGVVGVNDLPLMQKWILAAEDLIFNPNNKHFWNRMENKGQMNYLFEQYFIACILKGEKIEPEVLIKNFSYKNISNPEFKMTHFWGDTKRKAVEINKIKARLKREYPTIYKRINSSESDFTNQFADIYNKGKGFYHKLLDKAINKHGVRSIVYLGYNGLVSSKYIDADKNIDFIYTDSTKHIVPECDLLVINEVMGNWTGTQYSEFISNKINVKYILDRKGLYKK